MLGGIIDHDSVRGDGSMSSSGESRELRFGLAGGGSFLLGRSIRIERLVISCRMRYHSRALPRL